MDINLRNYLLHNAEGIQNTAMKQTNKQTKHVVLAKMSGGFTYIVVVTSLFMYICIPPEGCLHDTGTTFILVQVHSGSLLWP